MRESQQDETIITPEQQSWLLASLATHLPAVRYGLANANLCWMDLLNMSAYLGASVLALHPEYADYAAALLPFYDSYAARAVADFRETDPVKFQLCVDNDEPFILVPQASPFGQPAQPPSGAGASVPKSEHNGD